MSINFIEQFKAQQKISLQPTQKSAGPNEKVCPQCNIPTVFDVLDNGSKTCMQCGFNIVEQVYQQEVRIPISKPKGSANPIQNAIMNNLSQTPEAIRKARAEKKLEEVIRIIKESAKLKEEDSDTLRRTCQNYISNNHETKEQTKQSYKLLASGALYYLKTSGQLKNDQFKINDLVSLFGNSSGSKNISKSKIMKMKTKVFDMLRKSSKYFPKSEDLAIKDKEEQKIDTRMLNITNSVGGSSLYKTQSDAQINIQVNKQIKCTRQAFKNTISIVANKLIGEMKEYIRKTSNNGENECEDLLRRFYSKQENLVLSSELEKQYMQQQQIQVDSNSLLQIGATLGNRKSIKKESIIKPRLEELVQFLDEVKSQLNHQLRVISEAFIDSKLDGQNYLLELSSIPSNKELGAIGLLIYCLDNGKFKQKLNLKSMMSNVTQITENREFYKQQPIQLNQKLIIEFYYPSNDDRDQVKKMAPQVSKMVTRISELIEEAKKNSDQFKEAIKIALY